MHSFPASCAVGFAIGGMALGIVAMSAGESWPHDALPTAAMPQGWSYPWQCCSGLDCRQAKTGEIGERADGYHTPSGEVIPMTDKRIRQSPDGEFHWCAHQGGGEAGKTICLFVPGRGS
ncbi:MULTISPECIES: hypothetical protein [Mesorhizobium]|uniref:hypothetical protein n=1 Tax=Mesorhizobium TaxID=68287 RepID=UPI0010A9554D|nr:MULTISPECIES: hypothetical protein [Mesorhizobium]